MTCSLLTPAACYNTLPEPLRQTQVNKDSRGSTSGARTILKQKAGADVPEQGKGVTGATGLLDVGTSTGYRPQTAADGVAARLRAGMFEGRFIPGDTVSIRRIAEEEGVSVIPARDALRGLVAEGALEFRDSRTIVVPVLDTATLDQMAYARTAIEGELAERAFDRLKGNSKTLRALDADVTSAIRGHDPVAYMRTNRAFHFTIYQAAAAPVLLHLAEALWLRFAPSMRSVCNAMGGAPPGTDYHEAAIARLAAGDGPGFRAAIEADILQGMTTLCTDSETRKDSA